MRIVRSECPVCKSENIYFVLKAKDYTVSLKEFEIWHCDVCSMRFTQEIPGEEEISNYYKSENYISHSDTDKGIINSLYHKVRKRTLISKRNLVEKFSAMTNGKILDVGSGTGSFLNVMKQASWETVGLEPDEASRDKAKELYGLDLQQPGMLFKAEPRSFDAITLWHVLEHVHDLHDYVTQLKILLKPNGNLFIAVPNYTSYDQEVYQAFWAAYDVPRHLYHFSPNAMTRLLMEHQLKLKATKPMWFDSFYVSMLSEKYKTGKVHLIKALQTGLISNYRALKEKGKCSSLIYIIAK